MENLLKKLREQNVIISLENNDLRVRFNGTGLPASLVKELKEQKAKLVEYLSALEAQKGNVDIRPAPVLESYPLSSSQYRTWVLSQFDGANRAYNMPSALVLEGNLDIEALEEAFRQLIRRHEILRTFFKDVNTGEIRQFILPADEVRFHLSRRDLRQADRHQSDPHPSDQHPSDQHPSDQHQAELDKIVQSDIFKPFNLETAPLLRAGIYEVARGKWVFTYVMHHIISDGWSMDILLSDLMSFYHALIKGETPSLKPLPIQYKDYAYWQSQQLTGPVLEAHRSYWLKQFQGELPVLVLPGDHTRPTIKSYHGAAISKRIPRVTTKGLKTLCQQGDASLFMGLLGIVNVLLYRYTDQTDIIIGSPIAGREHRDLEDQIGLYLNTLALRSRFKGEDSFTGLLAHIKDVTLGAYEHQAVPFERLVDELQLKRDMSRSPLFDVMLILQNANERGAGISDKFGDIRVSGYPSIKNPASKFDLTFDFVEFGDELQGTIEYNSDIYEENTVTGLLNHLEQLMEAIIAHPSLPLQQLDYLSREEKERVLFQFNATGKDYPKEKTFVELFEEQVALTPDKTAVVVEGRILSYKELNQRANRLARYLRDIYAIGPDDLVGLCLDRTEYLLIGVLSVLKAGAAYVPMDPGYPEDRLRFMIKDTGTKVVLTNLLYKDRLRHLTDGLPASIEVMDEESFQTRLSAGYDPGNPLIAIGPGNLAYVIYTSGTTGMPKGVMVQHSSYVNLLWHYRNTCFKKNGQIDTASVTNYVFDIWGLEYGLPLISGGFIELFNPEFPSLETGRYTFLQLTPGLLLAKYDAIKFNNPHLKLLVGGEAVSQPLLAKLLYNHKLEGLLNVYGPTETTIWSVDRLNTNHQFNTNIGRPIANTTVYVLDQHRAAVPVGAVGELYIGGSGLARGYLNNPTLTGEKFVPNPFRPGERMYRTGDLGRWLPDGEIGFIGRSDDQVKINGHRIELGEIETVLLRSGVVNAAAVLARANAEGEKELVAYMTGKEGLQASDLRSYLSKYLPAYMVPARFIQLPEFPLTPNGKVDRNKLPEPKGLDLTTGVAYVSPRNEIEEELVAIWQELLGKDKIGIGDNFFDLGGNSIKILRMVMLSNRIFDKKISVAMAFRYPSIGTLAEYLAGGLHGAAGESEKELDKAITVMDETFNILNNDSHED